MAWDLLVDRSDLSHTELVDAADVDPGDGQVVLRVDRVGMTANNVTYAVFGDAMQYWDFFPAEPRDGVSYGRVPLWGFAEVEPSTVPEASPRAPASSATCRRAATSSSSPPESDAKGSATRARTASTCRRPTTG